MQFLRKDDNYFVINISTHITIDLKLSFFLHIPTYTALVRDDGLLKT